MTSLREKYQVDVPEGQSGDWKIERFTVTEQQASFDALRGMINGHGRSCPAGTFTGLYRRNSIIMSDVPDEIYDHMRFIHKAHGRVLIAGLGLGVVLQAVARKPEVTDIVVIEDSHDVISLVGPHYIKRFENKLAIRCVDVFEYKPTPGETYDCAWFDVWDGLCTDNLAEMAKLHRRWARRITGYYGSWGHGLLKRRREQERQAGW